MWKGKWGMNNYFKNKIICDIICAFILGIGLGIVIGAIFARMM